MKILYSIILFLCLSSSAWADGMIIGASAAACSTIQQSETSAASSNHTGNTIASKKWLATKFVATATYTACSVDLYMNTVGSPGAVNMTVYMYSDATGTYPNVLVGSGSGTVSSSGMSSSETAINFSGMSAPFTNGTTYWVVLMYSAIGDASNYVEWRRSLTGTTKIIVNDADGLGVWTGGSLSETHKYRIYK